MTSATEVPDSACLKANAICSSEKFFFAIQKPTLSGGAKVKNTNIPDGSRNGEDVNDLVVAAVRVIRYHACRGLKVADVVACLKTSRRVLEHRFVQRIGHTPHEEIARVQFRRVEQLLRETDLPLATIAERSGFRIRST